MALGSCNDLAHPYKMSGLANKNIMWDYLSRFHEEKKLHAIIMGAGRCGVWCTFSVHTY